TALASRSPARRDGGRRLHRLRSRMVALRLQRLATIPHRQRAVRKNRRSKQLNPRFPHLTADIHHEPLPRAQIKRKIWEATMSRRGLLFLLCLSVLLLSLVPLTHAGGEIKVDESRTRILIQNDPAEVQLAVENSMGEPVSATVQLEFLNPQDRIVAKSSSTQTITPGSQTLKLFIPFSLTSLKDNERRELLWYRCVTASMKRQASFRYHSRLIFSNSAS